MRALPTTPARCAAFAGKFNNVMSPGMYVKCTFPNLHKCTTALKEKKEEEEKEMGSEMRKE